MEKENYETFDLPAIGEIRAKEGTATYQMAGAIKYWHDKYQDEVVSVRLNSFIAGVAMSGMAALLSLGIYWLC